MNRIYLILFGILMCFSAVAQSDCNYHVEGYILDIDTKEPLPFATVGILQSTLGDITDEHGYFRISSICDEEVDLEIRFIGYKTLVHHHDFHHSLPLIFLASDEMELESVVIEESLGTHELQSLSASTMEVKSLDRLGTTSGDLVTQLSGVSMLKTGQNVAKPLVHGLHSNRVLIINNGVRHSYQAWGLEHAPEIDPSQVDRIKVIKGASTVRYGSDALGGVVLFDAPSPKYNSSLGGAINSGFQTNGQSFAVGGSLSEGYERAAWHASVSGIKQGDLRAADYRLTNTGKEEVGFSLGAKFHLPWVDIDIYGNRFDQKLGILRGSVNGNLEDLANAMQSEPPPETGSFSYHIRNPHQESTHDLLRLKTSLFTGRNQFDFQYAYQNNRRKEFDIRRGTNNERPAIDLMLISHSLDFDWDHPAPGNFEGTLGLQLSSQNNDNLPGTNTIPFVPNYDTQSAGVFVIESYKSGSTTFEAGVRFDHLNLDIRGRDSRNQVYRDNINYNNFSFTFGLQRPVGKNLSLSTNIGTAWRPPNVAELYSFGKHQSVIEYGLWRYELFPENDSISTRTVLSHAQKTVNNEIGLKWIASISLVQRDIQAEFTPYVNYIQNYLFLRPHGITNTVRGAFPYFIWDQTDAFYFGIDIDINKTWGKFDAEFKVSYVEARDTKQGQRFLFIPPLNMQGTLQRSFGKFSGTLKAEWTMQQWNEPPVIAPTEFIENSELSIDRTRTFDFRTPPKGFFLLGLGIDYKTNQFESRLEVSNLLNTSYRRYTDRVSYFADDLGFNLKLAFSYKF